MIIRRSMFTMHQNSVKRYIMLRRGGTEGSHTNVSKGAEFSQKQRRILCLLIANSVPQGTELRCEAQERPSRCGIVTSEQPSMSSSKDWR
jgi:hypothetical protein